MQSLQSPRDRYPFVLAAVVTNRPDLEPPLFGIFPLRSFLSEDRAVAFDIGPRRDWYQSAREYRLLTDEALRWLQSYYTKDDLANALFQAVPAYDGSHIVASDSRRVWASGRHPSEPWCWHIPDIMAVIDTTPAPTAPLTPAPTAPTVPTATPAPSVASAPPDASATPTPAATAAPERKGRGKNIDARMLKILSERPESLEWTCRQWAEHLDCSSSTVAGAKTWKKHILAFREEDRAQRLNRDRHRRY